MIVDSIIGVFLSLLAWLVGLFPDIVSMPTEAGEFFSHMVVANYFIPVPVFVVVVSTMVTAYAAKSIYLVLKFIRGGG